MTRFLQDRIKLPKTFVDF